MKDIQQLIKRDNQEGKYKDIFPKTFIDAVKDKESGKSLTDILSSFNMYFLSYNGSREQTRLQVPMSIRKTGLWITYVLYDKTVVTEWYAGEAIDDDSWKNLSNWRDGTNSLVGDISVSSDGYWVVNGVITTTKAQGEQGITPMLRVGSNNHLQASYTNGSSWVDVSTNPVYTQFRINNNKLEQSVDLGQTWTVVSDYIASWFRFTGTTGSSQAYNVGKIQISRDNGVTWSDLSGEFTNSLHIKGYVATIATLPSSAVQGDIYGVGPTYDPSDTEQTNPIYKLYVKDSTGWVDNGKFTSIAAGVVQDTGNSETAVMSQNAVSKMLYCYDVSKYHINNITGDPAYGTNKFTLLQAINTVPAQFRTDRMMIKFISSVDDILQVWLYTGVRDWNIIASSNWVNVYSSILGADYPTSAGMMNAKFDSIIPFICNKGFGVSFTQLQVDNFEKGYYYDVNGQKIQNAEPVTYGTCTVDVTQYSGGTLQIIAKSVANAYCHFVNSDNAVLFSFQTVDGGATVNIPTTSATLLISNRFIDLPAQDIIIKCSKERIKTSLESVTPQLAVTTIPLQWTRGSYYNDLGAINQNINYSITDKLDMTSYRGKTLLFYGECTQAANIVAFNSSGTLIATYQTVNHYAQIFITDAISTIGFTNRHNTIAYPYLSDQTLAKAISAEYVNQALASLSLQTRNNLSGKKVSFIGDSITAGTACSQLPYHQVFCGKYNCVDNPLGIGGSCIANNTKNGLSAQRFVTRATQSNLQDSSLIIVFGGTNDFSYDSKPVGDSFVESDITPSGNIGSKKLVAPTDTDTFTGALHELINTIRTNCPQVPIVFITPLQRGRYNSNNPNSDETNSNGNYLSDFSKAIKEICSFYSIPVLDLGSISQLDFMNSEISAKYSSDNLHPNCAGHKLIGELLFRFVEDNVVII